MVRLRRLSLTLPLIAALGLSGCGLVAPSDAVAQVGDRRLTNEDLQRLAATAAQPPVSDPSAPPTSGPAAVDGDSARNAIGLWVVDEMLAEELQTAGAKVTELEAQASYQDRVARVNQSFDQLVEARSDEIQDLIDQMSCLTVALGDATSMSIVTDEVENGTTLTDAIEAAQQNGLPIGTQPLGCFEAERAADELSSNAGDDTFAPVADSIATLEPGELSQTWELTDDTGQNTSATLYRLTPDEIGPLEFAAVAEQALLPEIIAKYDVHVSSAYGAFDADSLRVLPLG